MSSLYANINDIGKCLLWWNAHNHHLKGIPKNICAKPNGVKEINDYLDFFLMR